MGKTRDEDPDTLIFGLPDPLLFHRIRILPVTTDIKNYIHRDQNINKNQQIQA